MKIVKRGVVPVYTSIDLFSGPGGLATGFLWSNIKPLIAVEISDWTCETYSKTHNADILVLKDYNNSPDAFNHIFQPNNKTVLIKGDITEVSNELIIKILKERFNTNTVDVVTGGAPCESFSMAGQRREKDERDNLFLNILRVSRAIKSRMILFENVKGLFSKKAEGIKGKIYKNICNEFSTKQNGVSYRLVETEPNKVLLKASDYGVPQNRERIFLIGIREDLDLKFNYPEPVTNYISVEDAIVDLPQLKAGEESNTYTGKELNEYQKIMRGLDTRFPIPKHLNFIYDATTSLTSHKAVNHREKMIKRMSLIKTGESMKSAAERLEREGKCDLRAKLFPKKLYGARNRRLKLDIPSFTVTSHCLDEMVHPIEDRGLTPREVARLQSFPDWYLFEGPFVKFHSDPEQDRYEQIGDAIPPLLAYAIGKQIFKSLIDFDSKLIEQPTNEELVINPL
ncbi:DNA cytosine methyltransferase [Piscibacillus halophilus]|uniref:DNA cytosine methyltransferase n=1 Tax=Piscibacillus halophilus TaxID=571933 RepID=UPI00158C9D7C|nr:DNA cytosine methyltransferase [Piscibacillus halophilus]